MYTPFSFLNDKAKTIAYVHSLPQHFLIYPHHIAPKYLFNLTRRKARCRQRIGKLLHLPRAADFQLIVNAVKIRPKPNRIDAGDIVN